MAVNKMASKIQTAFFSLKLVVTVFASSSYDLVSSSVISSHLINKLSIMLAKYLPFL